MDAKLRGSAGGPKPGGYTAHGLHGTSDLKHNPSSNAEEEEEEEEDNTMKYDV